jgi:hypothetical protein
MLIISSWWEAGGFYRDLAKFIQAHPQTAMFGAQSETATTSEPEASHTATLPRDTRSARHSDDDWGRSRALFK